MKIDRSFPPSPRSKELLSKLNELYGPCIACKTCDGLCEALIDALMLPDIIVKDNRTSNDRAPQAAPDRP